jgi:TolB-like protein
VARKKKKNIFLFFISNNPLVSTIIGGIIVAIFSVIILPKTCRTESFHDSPPISDETNERIKAGEVIAFDLDSAISQAAKDIENTLVSNTSVAITNVNSTSEQFSAYVVNELITKLVGGRKLTVIAHNDDLAQIRAEQQFQISGDVSDETQRSIGHMIGAQCIISGLLTNIENNYRLTIKTINVETAKIETSTSASIIKDSLVKFLMGIYINSDSNSFIKTGIWEAEGYDVREWRGNLVILAANDYIMQGYFEWFAASNLSSGKEHFIGIYDSTANTITFKGISLENAKGTIASSTIYEAYISSDRNTLYDGFWFGRFNMAGRWEAKWKSE